VNTNLTIAYVADLRASPYGGLYRYNGTGTGLAGSWTYAYTLANNLFPSGGFQEILVDFSGASPRIYATPARERTWSPRRTPAPLPPSPWLPALPLRRPSGD
jgi:IS5 family transposase